MIRSINDMTAAAIPPNGAAAERTIAAGFARGLVELAVTKGASRRLLLERAGIEQEMLEDQDGRIRLASWITLMREGKVLAADPALALHFGEIDISEMSLLGLLGRAAQTKAEGFELLSRFWRLCADVDTGGRDRFQIVRDSDGTWMIDQRLDPNDTPEISEAAFVQMATMGRRMLPGGEHFRAVHFTHAAPPYREEYDRIFAVPVVFESDRNAFLLPEGWEAEPIALQPHYAVDILGAHAEGLLERLERQATTSGKVEALLADMLPTGSAKAPAIAGRLGVSEQTLYRRLKAEGATFAGLVDDLRHRLARHYLGDGKLSAKDAAYRLGFSDPASFSRAFKRWTGTSPTAFREGPCGH
jgi:AraC-like DNA-binding protein